MHWLTILFLATLLLTTLLRSWLNQRQIAAVRAHRERVPSAFETQVDLATHRKAADYTIARALLTRWNVLVDAPIALVFTLGGGIDAIDRAWQAAGWSPLWHGTAVVLTIGLLLWLINLPFDIYRKFGVESRFGFNRMSIRLYAADHLKVLVISLVLGGPLVFVILYLMESAGARWWLYASFVWIGFTLFITWAFPTYVAPLFNKFTPLDDQALRKRAETLLERCGFSSQGLFVMDGSRRSVHGNAYFAGAGRSKRIVIFDTLLARLQGPEIEAVLAHELGHLRLHHIRSRGIVGMILGIGAFAVLGAMSAWPDFYRALGVSTPSAHAALLLFMLLLPPFLFFLTPFAAWWSRKQEYEADAFAARFSDAGQLAQALVKLHRDNATTLTPDSLHAGFYDSHPTALARVSRLQSQSAAPG